MSADVRVSDEERLRVAGDLESAAGAGILTLVEVDERLRAVWHARTRSEVQALVADLPEEWLRARRRAEAAAQAARLARRTLPAHVRSWLALAALLVGIWVLTTPTGYFWPVWPILGTGICLLGHVRAARVPTSG